VIKCKTECRNVSFFDMRNAMGSLIFRLNDDLAQILRSWCYGDILVHNFLHGIIGMFGCIFHA